MITFHVTLHPVLFLRPVFVYWEHLLGMWVSSLKNLFFMFMKLWFEWCEGGGGGGGAGSSSSLAARRARGTELANRIAILPERVENINTLITFLHLRSSLRVKQLVLVDFKYICIYLTFI